MRPFLCFQQHLQAAQEVLHWKFSPREIKEDIVRNQRTGPALQKENHSLNPEEALQKEPAEEEVLKISVEEAAAVASVLEIVQGLLIKCFLTVKVKYAVHKLPDNAEMKHSCCL